VSGIDWERRFAHHEGFTHDFMNTRTCPFAMTREVMYIEAFGIVAYIVEYARTYVHTHDTKIDYNYSIHHTQGISIDCTLI
jgi:hypothetical protein